MGCWCPRFDYEFSPEITKDDRGLNGLCGLRGYYYYLFHPYNPSSIRVIRGSEILAIETSATHMGPYLDERAQRVRSAARGNSG